MRPPVDTWSFGDQSEDPGLDPLSYPGPCNPGLSSRVPVDPLDPDAAETLRSQRTV